MKISEEYAREFIRSTTWWDVPWVNDRDHPRYVRATKIVSVEKIDTLLREEIPEYYSQRR